MITCQKKYFGVLMFEKKKIYAKYFEISKDMYDKVFFFEEGITRLKVVDDN